MELSPQICTGVFQIGKWGGAWSAKGTAVEMVRAWPSLAALENCKRRGTPGFRILTEALLKGSLEMRRYCGGGPLGRAKESRLYSVGNRGSRKGFKHNISCYFLVLFGVHLIFFFLILLIF